MRLTINRQDAFTLVEIMIVVAIIGMLAAIAIPNLRKAINTSQANACIINMKQVDNAITQFSAENSKSESDAVSANDIKEYMKDKVMPTCPAGDKPYNLAGTIGATPSVTCVNENSTPKHKIGPKTSP